MLSPHAETLAAVLTRIEAGEAPASIVAFVLAQPARTMIALSHEIEDRAFDGTPYAVVFDLLCDGEACDDLLPPEPLAFPVRHDSELYCLEGVL